jgi:hypothetical protein
VLELCDSVSVNVLRRVTLATPYGCLPLSNPTKYILPYRKLGLADFKQPPRKNYADNESVRSFMHRVARSFGKLAQFEAVSDQRCIAS